MPGAPKKVGYLMIILAVASVASMLLGVGVLLFQVSTWIFNLNLVYVILSAGSINALTLVMAEHMERKYYGKTEKP